LPVGQHRKPGLTVSAAGFDPSTDHERQRHLESRLSSAVGRIADSGLIERVSHALTKGDATDLFALLVHDDLRVVSAAHECAMLRYAYIVAIAAQAFEFDGYQRDDLVQRTFLDLPHVVARVVSSGGTIPAPEGWLRHRAYLMARQMLREEHGAPVRDVESGMPRRDADGRILRTRGRRVPIEELDRHAEFTEDAMLAALDEPARREQLDHAIRALADEHPLWADIVRLHYARGYRLDEVAARVGRAHGTVRNDAQKARLRLAEIIRERYPDLVPPRNGVRGGSDDAEAAG
jgi:DNA-directed RNA polymerase specialized sigma24 family protein